MKGIERTIVSMGMIFAMGQLAFGQDAAVARSKRPEFEVVSIKPTQPGGIHLVGVQLTKDQLTMNVTTLKGLICVAYNIPYWELSGGEPWMNTGAGNLTDHYDLQAKLPLELAPYDLRHSSSEIEDERIREMMKSMLAERFHLQFHRETATGTLSVLELSGKPLMFVPSTLKYAERYGDGYSEIGGAVAGKPLAFYNVSMPQLAKFLSGALLHHPVIDKTGLDERYDFTSGTIVTSEDIQTGNVMSMWPGAVKEMGLRLTESNGPVESFVIDHAERPSAN